MAGIEKLVELADQGQLQDDAAADVPDKPPRTAVGRRRRGEPKVVVTPKQQAAIQQWVQAKPGGAMPKPPPLRRP